ncbi:DUF2231 domain-containing protein [Paraburkholderia sp. IW21]|uniref:DUF2231 domain-containing protein n=1 Tax=Paraburkholderia sp. IW21 TaxID=3242488 RepID=UPI003522272B
MPQCASPIANFFRRLTEDTHAYSREYLQASHPSDAGCLSDRSLGFSLVCDVIRVAGAPGEAWAIVALYSMVGGLVGALGAAIPGFIDLLFYKGGAPPVGKIALTHMAINLTVVVLYAINIWMRMRSPASVSPGLSTPVLRSIAGVALLFVSGWLGGQTVHVYGVGVEGRE